MTASVQLDLPAGLPAVVLIDGTPARPGEPVAVEPGPTRVELRVALAVAGWSVAGSVAVPVDVPPGATVRLTAPRLPTG